MPNKYPRTIDEFIPDATLDFHDRGILLPYDINKLLSEFIEDCYVNKRKNLLIITGKGDVVRPIAEKHLRSNKYVSEFKQAGYFHGQAGAFEVILVGDRLY